MSSASSSIESAFDRVYDLIKKNTKKENLEECSDFKKLKRVLTEIIDINYIQNYIKNIETHKDEQEDRYRVIIEFHLNKTGFWFGDITINGIGDRFTMYITKSIVGDSQLYSMDSCFLKKEYIKDYFEILYVLVNKDKEYAKLREEHDSFVNNIRDAVPQFLGERYHPNK